MKPPLLPAFLILFLLGLILWRETTAGWLVPLERSTALWLHEAMGGQASPAPPVVLVLQGGIRGDELSALDVGLFTRATAQLGAATAAIAAWQIPPSEIRLLPPRPAAVLSPPRPAAVGSVSTRFLAGAILLSQPSREGEAPTALALPGPLPPRLNNLPEFAGSFSSFPAGQGWGSGFLNLPSAPGGSSAEVERGFPLLARWQGEVVPSFSLAAVLAALPDYQLGGGDELSFGPYQLAVSPSGTLPLEAELLPRLQRVDMDDLLLEAERLEKNLPGDEALQQTLRGSIALLGTLTQEDEILTAPGSGRRLSLVEYQGLAIQSFLYHLRPPMAPWWWGVLYLVLLCPTATSLWFLRPDTAVISALLLLCGTLLLAGALSAQFHLLLPALLPLVFWPGAALLRLFLRRPRGMMQVAIPQNPAP